MRTWQNWSGGTGTIAQRRRALARLAQAIPDGRPLASSSKVAELAHPRLVLQVAGARGSPPRRPDREDRAAEGPPVDASPDWRRRVGAGHRACFSPQAVAHAQRLRRAAGLRDQPATRRGRPSLRRAMAPRSAGEGWQRAAGPGSSCARGRAAPAPVERLGVAQRIPRRCRWRLVSWETMWAGVGPGSSSWRETPALVPAPVRDAGLPGVGPGPAAYPGAIRSPFGAFHTNLHPGLNKVRRRRLWPPCRSA